MVTVKTFITAEAATEEWWCHVWPGAETWCIGLLPETAVWRAEGSKSEKKIQFRSTKYNW